ncbi:hypothetical protein P245_24945 [Comamonas thiooxydans]|uniref:Uncharacterized protein n=1 Tax=Comamonas thiooxydans TaxID=363952 RepID=A0A0E3BDW3_9BURK|nr:hypothetical protein [Comamonas thiooxydans]KGG83715.1 hypothetical protein P245_24945 [Comamonas thiooxydans]
MELSAPALDAELARIVAHTGIDPHGLAVIVGAVVQVAGGERPAVLKRFLSCSTAVWVLAMTAPLMTGLCTSGRA